MAPRGIVPEIHYYFWKDRLVECTSRGRESSRCLEDEHGIYRLHFRSQAVRKEDASRSPTMAVRFPT